MTDLDALATAVILNEADMAAWGSFVDYCEENGLTIHPRALRSICYRHGLGVDLQRRIYDLSWSSNPRWRTWAKWDAEVTRIHDEWAIPLVNHVRNRPLARNSASTLSTSASVSLRASSYNVSAVAIRTDRP